MSLQDEIEAAINRHSAENGSDTPDFILARYLTAQLEVFGATVRARDAWYRGAEERADDLTAEQEQARLEGEARDEFNELPAP